MTDKTTLGISDTFREFIEALEAKEGTEKEPSAKVLNSHEYVDLGLPSGTLWARCNIGAIKPEEYGDYYAWGETSTKNTFNWTTYKYAKGDSDELTKYCTLSAWGNAGFTDNLTELQRGDDPASSWGSGWYTPTLAQWEELLANTTNEWTTQNGVKGRLFTSEKNGETLFLPAAFGNDGSYGYYWSRSLYIDLPDHAWGLRFLSDSCYMKYYGRANVFCVRPVHQS